MHKAHMYLRIQLWLRANKWTTFQRTLVSAWVLRQDSLAVDIKDHCTGKYSTVTVFLSHPVATEISPRTNGTYPFSRSPENTFKNVN